MKTLPPLALALALASSTALASTVADKCQDVSVIDPETGEDVAMAIRLPEDAVIDLEPKGEWKSTGDDGSDQSYYVMKEGSGEEANAYGWPDGDLLAECVADMDFGSVLGGIFRGVGDISGGVRGFLHDLACTTVSRYTTDARNAIQGRIQEFNQLPNRFQQQIRGGGNEEWRQCIRSGASGGIYVTPECLSDEMRSQLGTP